ncbi:MAG: hypothetical protein KME57_09005 [Scytonema hyalinum WJT4-NPBG1]|nr:hypothetical protein [Scytonema hyalinum WJT4-NPBG1]
MLFAKRAVPPKGDPTVEAIAVAQAIGIQSDSVACTFGTQHAKINEKLGF